jgi:hypothetical protein
MAVLGLGMFSTPSYAEDRYAAFKWNVAHERATIAQTPQSLSAASAADAAAQLFPERLCALSLLPRNSCGRQRHSARKPGLRALSAA